VLFTVTPTKLYCNGYSKYKVIVEPGARGSIPNTKSVYSSGITKAPVKLVSISP
jgi:hypothetical protein